MMHWVHNQGKMHEENTVILQDLLTVGKKTTRSAVDQGECSSGPKRRISFQFVSNLKGLCAQRHKYFFPVNNWEDMMSLRTILA